MPLMLDRILAGEKVRMPAFVTGEERARQWDLMLSTLVREKLPEATAVEASNVAEYLYAASDQEEWDVRYDFPAVAPPFPVTWIEHGRPSRIRSAGRGDARVPPHLERFGACITADEAPPLALAERGARWVLSIFAFIQERGGILGPGGFVAFGVDSEGRAVLPGGVLKHFMYCDSERSSLVGEWMGSQISVPLLTVSFFHCKNVSVTARMQPAGLAKKFRKRHGREPVRYRVLEIEPMKQVLRSQGSSDSVGLKKALHICRGHFKDYRQSGLFGRYRGLYWWDQHVRGAAKEGIALKDYAIGPGLLRDA